jgi:hypothetical protein
VFTRRKQKPPERRRLYQVFLVGILPWKHQRPQPLRSPLRWLIDRLDERTARRLRRVLGQDRWLVSWQRENDGFWRARLSCPLVSTTLERTGRTRTEAIDRATRALTHLLSLRGVLLDRRKIQFTRPLPTWEDFGS